MGEVRFAQRARLPAFGRNGTTKAIGLVVWTAEGEVQLQPINSRGKYTRCRIPVPRASIPDLIKELQCCL